MAEDRIDHDAVFQESCLDNYRDYVDVVITYRCKLCDFSASDPLATRHHVTAVHFRSSDDCGTNNKSSSVTSSTDNVTADVQEMGNELANGRDSVSPTLTLTVTGDDDMQLQMNSSADRSDRSKANSSDCVQLLLNSDIGDKQSNLCEPGDSGICNTLQIGKSGSDVTKEIFFCSLCGTGHNWLGIVEHMREVHGMHIESGSCDSGVPEVRESSESNVALPPQLTSTGTQVQLLKKPGRKRKLVITNPISEEECNMVDTATGDNPTVKVETVERDLLAVRALGIERVTDIDGVDCKRRIRPPRLLVKDYDILPRRHKKHNQFVSTKLRCQVPGCGAVFSSEDSLIFHTNFHTSSDNSELCCTECGLLFPAWNKLRCHLSKSHGIAVDKYRCIKCDFRCMSSTCLEEHSVSVHSRQRRKIRNKKLVPHHDIDADETVNDDGSVGDNGQLKQSDSSVAVHECPTCDRTFVSKKCLQKHVETVHDKIRLFVCTACGYKTPRHATLRLHLRIHTGEKPFRCDMCLFMASDHNTLRRHRMRHTGEKPYSCSFCMYACIQAASLKVHMRAKHPEAALMGTQETVVVNGDTNSLSANTDITSTTYVYACQECPYQTINRRSFQRHLSDHRKNLLPIGTRQKANLKASEPVSSDYHVAVFCSDIIPTNSNISAACTDVTSTAVDVATVCPPSDDTATMAVSETPTYSLYSVISYG